MSLHTNSSPEPALPDGQAALKMKDLDVDPEMDLLTATPIERLRYFLSQTLRPQDWLDVEPFLNALTPTEVWMAVNKTSQVCLATKEDAERFVSGFAGSVAGGFSITPAQVMRVAKKEKILPEFRAVKEARRVAEGQLGFFNRMMQAKKNSE